MICADTTIGSMPWCGDAPWLPSPVTTISKKPTAAIAGPTRHRNVPAFASGQLCSPNTLSMRAAIKQTVLHHHVGAALEFLRRLENQIHRAVEVARLREVFCRPQQHGCWPSCPQACITPGFWLACSRPVSSWIGSASMSARRPIARSDDPARITRRRRKSPSL